MGECWVELAVEWRFVRLTLLERRRRAFSFQLQPLTNFLELDKEGSRFRGWWEMWAGLLSRIVTLVFRWGVRAA